MWPGTGWGVFPSRTVKYSWRERQNGFRRHCGHPTRELWPPMPDMTWLHISSPGRLPRVPARWYGRFYAGVHIYVGLVSESGGRGIDSRPVPTYVCMNNYWISLLISCLGVYVCAHSSGSAYFRTISMTVWIVTQSLLLLFMGSDRIALWSKSCLLVREARVWRP